MSRRKFTLKFQFNVVLEALSERYNIRELGRKYKIYSSQVTNWKSQFLINGQAIFVRPGNDVNSESREKEEWMLTTIVQPKREIDSLKKASNE